MELHKLTNRDIYVIYKTFKSILEKYDETFRTKKSSVSTEIMGMPASIVIKVSDEEIEEMKESPSYKQTLHVVQVLEPLVELIESSDDTVEDLVEDYQTEN